MFKGAGDSSLRFGLTRRDCGRVGERSGDSKLCLESGGRRTRKEEERWAPPFGGWRSEAEFSETEGAGKGVERKAQG